MITKVKESWKINLSEGKKQLFGSVTDIGFATGQKVWCYWKTVDGKENVISRENSSKFGMIPVLKRSKQMNIR